ncbi:ABC transporter substrate-binding protein [Paenibacillus naphthalenovorans]|uniref:ABC transporter substrate-binding protein n=1 Tax=Paenibacillus naphthalenovorans TaxID=162209 RepID=A0A0U2M6G2_9BACL|nr:ABC transporter substrate-binding protein [Paenibacillus naphthalenovorans]ALS23504.1 ABC transporter substrate-binding protein [Paenibacillus naphthalenovorans]GCL74428.1 ABC transporter substrate-binding protein [Paenibacillus naphthalenovorans]SDJ03734.1 iron complex transport system substrate-binding protein [Paenibacillus naphthalenovorans]
MYWDKTTRIKKRLLAAVLSLALAGTLAGCGSAAPAPGQGQQAESPKAGDARQEGSVTSAKRTTYPLTVKDATGKEFVFEKAPERIVSTSPSETETLFALGLGDQVVGVSDFCNYPAEAAAKPKVGSIIKPNEEALVAANADLVMTGVSMNMTVVEKLRGLKVNLFKVEPKTLDDVMSNILLMGQIFDRQEQAEKLVDSMKAERQKVLDAVKDLKPEQKKKVFVEFSPGWTVGKGEYIDELISLAGGINVAGGEKGYVKLSEEKVIADNPQIILYPTGIIDEKSNKPMDQLIRERSGWDRIEAVKSNRLVGLDKDIMSRPGPRITQALTEVAKGIYPELVK